MHPWNNSTFFFTDLLESHYDRPAATTMQHPEDHVYDEIPLAAPFNLNGGANKYAT